MIAICVASPEGQAGKTALCSTIGRRLQNEGRKVGYIKAVTVRADDGPDKETYRDCDFLNDVLGLGKPPETLCPVVVSHEELAAAGNGKADMAKKVQESYQELSRDKDVMVIEGPAGLRKDSPSAELLAEILAAIPAKLVVVLQYSESPLQAELDAMDRALKSKMIGVIINGVPSNRMAQKGQLASGLDTAVFGVIPQDRSLMGLSVKDIIDALNAQEVTAADGASELVENIMVGAAVLEHGPTYFGRKPNKAVLMRGERPDMQLAALETATKVLVLTGGVRPIDRVLKQARRRKVPVVITQQDTMGALNVVSDAVRRTSFSHMQKLNRLDELLAESLDFRGLYQALGL